MKKRLICVVLVVCLLLLSSCNYRISIENKNKSIDDITDDELLLKAVGTYYDEFEGKAYCYNEDNEVVEVQYVTYCIYRLYPDKILIKEGISISTPHVNNSTYKRFKYSSNWNVKDGRIYIDLNKSNDMGYIKNFETNDLDEAKTLHLDNPNHLEWLSDNPDFVPDLSKFDSFDIREDSDPYY